jgi:hypothetical protein
LTLKDDTEKDGQAVFLGAETNFALWCLGTFDCSCSEYTTEAGTEEEQCESPSQERGEKDA